jgi:NAD(P)-dependent dehydrogenase (short-subunit alcohol dehydrogenase family)
MQFPSPAQGRVAGKIAIVTGAGSQGPLDGIGIGRAIAMRLAAEGAALGCIDIDRVRAERTCALISERGGRAIALAADVAVEAQCQYAVATVVERLGAPQVLVNNVGITTPCGPVTQLAVAAWRQAFEANLLGAMLMTKYAMTHLTAAGSSSIINIGSIAGMRAHGGGVTYGPSKAALTAFTREIALMHGREGVRANVVAPGHLATPLARSLLGEETRQRRRAVGPLGIEGDAWDVANTVLFLASDEARFLTGLEVPVDGGVSAIGPLAAYELIEGAKDEL